MFRTSRMMFFLMVIGLLYGCTSAGPLEVQEVYYLAVQDKDNTNYYRVRVDARTQYSKASYDSHWFPAEVVDRYYGDAEAGTLSETIKMETDIRDLLNSKIKSVQSAYLDVAENPETSDEDIVKWMRVKKRLRATSGVSTLLPEEAIEMEYDPNSNLTLRHAGQKFIMILAADPDEVIGEIANFSQDAKTGASILRLADIVRLQTNIDNQKLAAKNNAQTTIESAIGVQIEAAILAITDESNQNELITQVEALQMLVEAMK